MLINAGEQSESLSNISVLFVNILLYILEYFCFINGDCIVTALMTYYDIMRIFVLFFLSFR